MSSNESVNQNDNVYFGVTTHHPSGGALVDADATPKWQIFENATDAIVIEGDFTKRTITGVLGTYRGTTVASSANGFETGKYYEIHASGMVNSVVGRAIIKSFVVDNVYDANIVQVSGQDQYAPGGVLQTNVVQVSGESVNIQSFTAEADVYYADVNFLKDKTNNRDEYNVSWFKNAQPLGSGDITGPRINVIKTSDGTDLIADRTLNYTSPVHGSLRYNETTNTAIAVSGEAYMVKVSGIIDASYRQWSRIVGIDELY